MIVQAAHTIKSLPEALVFPLGNCHGDLTLSNIIFDQSVGVTLIDFLDTYLESPLQDIAKLKQDYVYGWSFRNELSPLKIKSEIMCRYFFPQAIVEIERVYPVQVRVLTLMSLVRIAPYVRDNMTKKWLYSSLTNCLGISLI
jgi:thiamine kinase-like enzyme